MKNKIIIVFILLGCLPFFGGCDSSVKKLEMNSIIGDDYLLLPFKADKATAGGLHISFSTDMTLKEMGEKIKSQNISTEISGSDFLLIIKTIPKNKTRYYMIAKKSNGLYEFMCPASDITGNYLIFTPFHLLGLSSENQSSGLPYGINADTEYKINSTYEKIADFYKAVGDIYDVAEEESRILISVKEDSYISEGYARHIRKGSFAIEFEEKTDGNYVTYRIIE